MLRRIFFLDAPSRAGSSLVSVSFRSAIIRCRIIVADIATQEDLFAWSASYLRGIGPLTAQTRVMTTATLQKLIRSRPLNSGWRVAGGFLGLIIGEVLMHARRILPAEDISLSACKGTLSFALLRSLAIGYGPSDFSELAESWAKLRTAAGQTRTAVHPTAVAQIVSSFANGIGDYSGPGVLLDPVNGWFEILLREGPFKCVSRVLSAFGPSPWELDVQQFSTQTAEERVKLFDQILPTIVSHAGRNSSEKSFAIALLGFTCRPGLMQQAQLLHPVSAEFPEAVMWLGAMQVLGFSFETLAVGSGVGWRVARDLFEPVEPFGTPTCDIAFSELLILNRGKGSNLVHSIVNSRLDVEITPGVTALVRNSRVRDVEQQQFSYPPKPPSVAHRYDDELEQVPTWLVSDAERAIEALSNFVQQARRLSSPESPSAKKRRR
jgi:hypothetical protein